jgi:two-component sensor histidine kinase
MQTMLEAHEALSEAAPENTLRFKDVLDFLRQDLHQSMPETLRSPLKLPNSDPPVN